MFVNKALDFISDVTDIISDSKIIPKSVSDATSNVVTNMIRSSHHGNNVTPDQLQRHVPDKSLDMNYITNNIIAMSEIEQIHHQHNQQFHQHDSASSTTGSDDKTVDSSNKKRKLSKNQVTSVATTTGITGTETADTAATTSTDEPNKESNINNSERTEKTKITGLEEEAANYDEGEPHDVSKENMSDNTTLTTGKGQSGEEQHLENKQDGDNGENDRTGAASKEVEEHESTKQSLPSTSPILSVVKDDSSDNAKIISQPAATTTPSSVVATSTSLQSSSASTVTSSFLPQPPNNNRSIKRNSPGALSTYLSRHHPNNRYIIINISDRDLDDDRTLLLLNKQILRFHWTESCCVTDKCEVPSISSLFDICYAMQSYLSLNDAEEENGNHDNKYVNEHYYHHQHDEDYKYNKPKRRKNSQRVALIYCNNGKTRTGIVIACYLKYIGLVPTALDGFYYFCSRRCPDIYKLLIDATNNSNAHHHNINSRRGMPDHTNIIPPSLYTFFRNFTDCCDYGGYVAQTPKKLPRSLYFKAIALQGIPVDDMPCIDIYTNCNNLLYTSHPTTEAKNTAAAIIEGDTTTSQENDNRQQQQQRIWADEEGFFHINKAIQGDFVVLCRFGGLYADDRNDPSKILFRYANTTGFLSSNGPHELFKTDVDLMRRYESSFDDDFLLTLMFNDNSEETSTDVSIGAESSSSTNEKKENLPPILFGSDALKRGWELIGKSHALQPTSEDINGIIKDDERHQEGHSSHQPSLPPRSVVSLALQLTNNDIDSAQEFLSLPSTISCMPCWEVPPAQNSVIVGEESPNPLFFPSMASTDTENLLISNLSDRPRTPELSPTQKEDDSAATFKRNQRNKLLAILDGTDDVGTDIEWIDRVQGDLVMDWETRLKKSGNQSYGDDEHIPEQHQQEQNDFVFFHGPTMGPNRGDVVKSLYGSSYSSDLHLSLPQSSRNNNRVASTADTLYYRAPFSSPFGNRPKMPVHVAGRKRMRARNTDDDSLRSKRHQSRESREHVESYERGARYFDRRTGKIICDHSNMSHQDKARLPGQRHSSLDYLDEMGALELFMTLNHTGVVLEDLLSLQEHAAIGWNFAESTGESEKLPNDKSDQPLTIGIFVSSSDPPKQTTIESAEPQHTEQTEQNNIANNESTDENKNVVDGDNDDEDELPLKDDPEYSKYFKMLAMGLNKDAVKHAMQRDNKDTFIIDLDPSKSLKSQTQGFFTGFGDDDDDEEEKPKTDPPLKDDPEYSKYFKMLKMGLPDGAVRHALQKDGKDPGILDLNPEKSLKSQTESEDKKDADTGPPLKDDPEYSKYFKMLKMGLPDGAVRHALQKDGKDPGILDLDPEKSLKSQISGGEKKDADTGPPLKDDPEYSKYFKMLKMGLPDGAVRHALQKDGKDPGILDLDPEKSLMSQTAGGSKEVDDGPILKDDPKYSKYFKMLKMMLPMDAVKHAMQKDGLDPSIMDLDHNRSLKSQMSTEATDTGIPLKDDTEFSKYFKMLKMGLPKGAVQNAMERDGKDPSILDLDPDKSVAFQLQNKGKKVKAKKSAKKKNIRRKKIYWNPIDPNKVKGESIWSLVKGTLSIEKLKFDKKEFEDLFTEEKNAGAQKKKKSGGEDKAKEKKKTADIIDGKRGMNGGIVLARLKIEYPKIAEMVDTMESGCLDDTQLRALKEFLPTDEESMALGAYMKKAEVSEEAKKEAMEALSECEKYMVAMMKVEKAADKFDCMLFKTTFRTNIKELLEGRDILKNACDEVRNSERLRKIMAMILTLVNEINTGGSGKMAVGFSLDALSKLNEAKAFDKKTSVLEYLVKLVRHNDKSLLDFKDDIKSSPAAAGVILDTLAGDIKNVQTELEKLHQTAVKESERLEGLGLLKQMSLTELMEQRSEMRMVDGQQHFNKINHKSGRTPMERFTLRSKEQVEEVAKSVEDVKTQYVSLLNFFGEDEKMPNDEFFGTINRFVESFVASADKVEKAETKRLKEEKRAKAKAEAQAKKEKAAAEKLAAEKSKRDIILFETDDAVEAKKRGSSGNLSSLDNTGETSFPELEGPLLAISATATEGAKKSHEPKHSYISEGPNFDERPSSNSLAGGEIAAAAAMAAAKQQQKAEVSGEISQLDEKTLPNPFAGGGIAAAAAMAAAKKQQKSSATGEDGEEPQTDDKASANPFAGGGIAAAAAMAAAKKQEKAEKSPGDSQPLSSPFAGGGIAAAAAMAAAKKQQKSSATGEEPQTHGKGPSNPFAEGGIVATAALAAAKKQQQTDAFAEGSQSNEKGSSSSFAGGGIAAAAAMAAAKIQQQSSSDEEQSRTEDKTSSNPFAGGGIAAAAAMAAAKKQQQAEASARESQSDEKGLSNPFAGGGIAAAAAMAAAKKQQQSSPDEKQSRTEDKTSSNPFAGGGIAAAAAMAAAKKQQQAESFAEDPHLNENSSSDLFAGGGIAAAAAMAAAKKQQQAETPARDSQQDEIPLSSPFAGGGIAAAAAMAAARNPFGRGRIALATTVAERTQEQHDIEKVESKPTLPGQHAGGWIAAEAALEAQKQSDKEASKAADELAQYKDTIATVAATVARNKQDNTPHKSIDDAVVAASASLDSFDSLIMKTPSPLNSRRVADNDMMDEELSDLNDAEESLRRELELANENYSSSKMFDDTEIDDSDPGRGEEARIAALVMAATRSSTSDAITPMKVNGDKGMWSRQQGRLVRQSSEGKEIAEEVGEEAEVNGNGELNKEMNGKSAGIKSEEGEQNPLQNFMKKLGSGEWSKSEGNDGNIADQPKEQKGFFRWQKTD